MLKKGQYLAHNASYQEAHKISIGSSPKLVHFGPMDVVGRIDALNFKDERKAVVTIGNFDGFHIGHRSLAEAVVLRARRLGARAIAVTFEPHPREVLSPGLKIPRLSTLADQENHFRQAGFDGLLRLNFNHDLQRTSAADFLKNLLNGLSMSDLVIGHDFRLGSNREGDRVFLEQWCMQNYVNLHPQSAVDLDGVTVSSQRIRSALNAGEMSSVHRMLGRRFSLGGLVVPGEQRGRLLGFPTANIQVDPSLQLPRFGVYAGFLDCQKKTFKAIANIGNRPTFVNKDTSLEVHVLNWTGDLYGETVRFHFVDFVREERKFSGIEELKSQISNDVLRTWELLETIKS